MQNLTPANAMGLGHRAAPPPAPMLAAPPDDTPDDAPLTPGAALDAQLSAYGDSMADHAAQLSGLSGRLEALENTSGPWTDLP